MPNSSYELVLATIQYGPIFLAPLGLTLIGLGLRTEKISWRLSLSGFLVLLLMFCILAYGATISDDVGIIELISGMIAMIGIGIACLMLLIFLSKRRKLFAPTLFILLPVIMFYCIQCGGQFAPERTKEKNTKIIADALERYRTANQRYPENLGALVPRYLDALPERPEWNYGWLYKTTGDQFTLGYACWIDRYDITFCLYKPGQEELEWVTQYELPVAVATPPATPVFLVGPTPAR